MCDALEENVLNRKKADNFIWYSFTEFFHRIKNEYSILNRFKNAQMSL